MVKVKNRYVLVRLESTDKAKLNIPGHELYREMLRLISEFHGDFGHAKCSRITVKIMEDDIAVIRVPADDSTIAFSVLPFIRVLKGVSLTASILFVGRSIRTLQKRLVKIRRNELTMMLSKCESLYERKKVLEAIRSVTGKIEFEGRTES
ncbi:unnamed protein product, partial [Mesorhabditis spiculigera]